MADDPRSEQLAELLGLIVHDLRNPAATLGANLSFFKEVAVGPGADEDLREAVEDMETALTDLRRGLDQLGWIARRIGEQTVLPVADGDAVTALETARDKAAGMDVTVRAPERPLRARAGGTLTSLLDILLANSRVHARGSPVELTARREGGEVVVELRDRGPAIAPELREAAFTLEGQSLLKGKAEGRYSRAGGLFAARVLADAMGSRIEAGGESGAAWFRIRLAAL